MSNGPGHAAPWINRGAGRSGWDYVFVPSPKAAAAKGKFESPRNQLWCQIVMTSASSPIFFPFARTCEYTQGFPEGSVVKNLPAVQGMQVQSLGQKDALEKEMAISLQYSCLGNPMDGKAWRLQFMGSQ